MESPGSASVMANIQLAYSVDVSILSSLLARFHNSVWAQYNNHTFYYYGQFV